jgi:hypothetical protein
MLALPCIARGLEGIFKYILTPRCQPHSKLFFLGRGRESNIWKCLPETALHYESSKFEVEFSHDTTWGLFRIIRRGVVFRIIRHVVVSRIIQHGVVFRIIRHRVVFAPAFIDNLTQKLPFAHPGLCLIKNLLKKLNDFQIEKLQISQMCDVWYTITMVICRYLCNICISLSGMSRHSKWLKNDTFEFLTIVKATRGRKWILHFLEN